MDFELTARNCPLMTDGDTGIKYFLLLSKIFFDVKKGGVELRVVSSVISVNSTASNCFCPFVIFVFLIKLQTVELYYIKWLIFISRTDTDAL